MNSTKLSYSLIEASEATSISVSKLRKMIAAGTLHAKHIGRRVVISARELESLVLDKAA